MYIYLSKFKRYNHIRNWKTKKQGGMKMVLFAAIIALLIGLSYFEEKAKEAWAKDTASNRAGSDKSMERKAFIRFCFCVIKQVKYKRSSQDTGRWSIQGNRSGNVPWSDSLPVNRQALQKFVTDGFQISSETRLNPCGVSPVVSMSNAMYDFSIM